MAFYLILDTETDGYFKDFNQPFTNTENWPPIKQIAWIIAEEYGNEVIERNFHIVKNEDTKAIFQNLITDINEYKPIIVGHNIDFDSNIVGAEFVRLEFYNHILNCELICTMNSTIDYCGLENDKWPRLQELYTKIFNTPFEGAHDALNDVKATSKCFFYLKNSGFKFTSFRDSISNYAQYERQIKERRENHFLNIYRGYAIQELLRLFRLKSTELSIDDEINFYQNNFYKFSLEQLGKNGTNDLNLSEVQKEFYLTNESPLLKLLSLDKLNDSFTEEAKEKLKSFPIGGDLFLYCALHKHDDDRTHFKLIAKEFFNYLFSYELYLRANVRHTKNNNTGEVAMTMDDLIESLKSKITNNQIKMVEVPTWLALIFHKDIYNYEFIASNVLEGRKIRIKEEIVQLAQLIELSRPKLKTQQEFIQFTAFLQHIHEAMPTEFKADIQKIRSSFNQSFEKKKDGCFVATLVYGSYDNEEVLLLREYRDTHLKGHLFGRAFISTYYFLSPTLVKFLKNKPFVNSYIKNFLDIILKHFAENK